MRHNKSFNHLSRKKAHRDALLANMTVSLIQHKRIFTTRSPALASRRSTTASTLCSTQAMT